MADVIPGSKDRRAGRGMPSSSHSFDIQSVGHCAVVVQRGDVVVLPYLPNGVGAHENGPAPLDVVCFGEGRAGLLDRDERLSPDVPLEVRCGRDRLDLRGRAGALLQFDRDLDRPSALSGRKVPR